MIRNLLFSTILLIAGPSFAYDTYPYDQMLMEMPFPIDIDGLGGGGIGGGALTMHTNPDGIPPRIKDKLKTRCRSDYEMSPAECKQTQNDAYDAGCINKTERDWLRSNSHSPYCIGGSLKTVCPCSCFDKSVQILTGSMDELQWRDAAGIHHSDAVVTLSEDADLDNISFNKQSFQSRGIRYTTLGEEEPDLFVFELSNGRSLAVSQNHGILLSSGMVVTAKEVSTDNRLVSMEGEIIDILSITRQPAEDGFVYNFLVDGDSKASHLVVAEGVIVGDAMWQGTYANYLNMVMERL